MLLPLMKIWQFNYSRIQTLIWKLLCVSVAFTIKYHLRLVPSLFRNPSNKSPNTSNNILKRWMFVFSDRKIYRAGVPPNSREIQEGLLTLSYTVGRPWRWSSQQSIGKREWVTSHLYIARLTIHFFVDIIQDCKGV